MGSRLVYMVQDLSDPIQAMRRVSMDQVAFSNQCRHRYRKGFETNIKTYLDQLHDFLKRGFIALKGQGQMIIHLSGQIKYRITKFSCNRKISFKDALTFTPFFGQKAIQGRKSVNMVQACRVLILFVYIGKQLFRKIFSLVEKTCDLKSQAYQPFVA